MKYYYMFLYTCLLECGFWVSQKNHSNCDIENVFMFDSFDELVQAYKSNTIAIYKEQYIFKNKEQYLSDEEMSIIEEIYNNFKDLM